MNTGNLKNIVVLKDLPSNLVEEAIVVLKENQKIPKLEPASTDKKESNSEPQKIKNSKDYIIKEAQMLISEYISKIESKNKKENQSIPKTKTGPATVNIFPPTPITYPSDLYSIAGETIELAKPVIGTKEPAPANFPILLNKLRPVKNAEIPISKMETIVLEVDVSKPRSLQILKITWPIVQINPPTQKALKQFFNIGEFGDFLSTYFW